MKVLKVILDEIPYGCEVCRWMTYDGYCDLVEKALPEISDERPDWCPLITLDDLLKETMSPFRDWETESEDQ